MDRLLSLLAEAQPLAASLAVCSDEFQVLLTLHGDHIQSLQTFVASTESQANLVEAAIILGTGTRLTEEFATILPFYLSELCSRPGMALYRLVAYIRDLSELDPLECCTRYPAIMETLDRMNAQLDASALEYQPWLSTMPNKAIETLLQSGLPRSLEDARYADRLALKNTLRGVAKDVLNLDPLFLLPPIPGDVQPFMTLLQEEMWSYAIASQEHRDLEHWLRAIHHRTGQFPVHYFTDIKISRYKPIESNDFADIWKGNLPGGDAVSIKVLRRAKQVQDRLLAAMKEWTQLQHPNIQSFIGIYSHPGVFLGMVSFWMDNGDAMSFMRVHRGMSPVKLLWGAARGLEYLHSHNIPHGDLRPANLLVDNDGNTRLSSYGLAQIFQDVESADKGDPRFMAPELLDPELIGLDAPLITTECDLHSFAMTVIELVTGERPYHTKGHNDLVIHEVVRNVRPKQRPRDVGKDPLTDHLWALAKSCWSFPPERRPTIASVVEDLETTIASVAIMNAKEPDESPIVPDLPELAPENGNGNGNGNGLGTPPLPPPDSAFVTWPNSKNKTYPNGSAYSVVQLPRVDIDAIESDSESRGASERSHSRISNADPQLPDNSALSWISVDKQSFARTRTKSGESIKDSSLSTPRASGSGSQDSLNRRDTPRRKSTANSADDGDYSDTRYSPYSRSPRPTKKKIPLDKSRTDSPHFCDWPGCNKQYSRWADLKRHEESQHVKAQSHVCSGCGKSFNRSDSLLRHVKSQCLSKSNICAQCERVFSAHDVLERHLEMQGGLCRQKSRKE